MNNRKLTIKENIKNLTVSALLLSIGLLLPFLTGQVPTIGNMLLPMHFPVLICGLICGWQYGMVVGFVLPLLRSAIFGMPIMFPTAIAMAFELCTYGFIIGFIYGKAPKKNIASLYISLGVSMVGGRIVWAIARLILSGVGGSKFTWAMFLSGAITTAIPGIIIQLILIPTIMVALGKAGLVPYYNKSRKAN